MKRTSPERLEACLARAGIDLSRIARSGGGVWLFGSRASACARTDSDWDLLVVSNSVRGAQRTKRCGIDLSCVPLDDVLLWSTSELGAHVSAYGIRLDGGRTIKLQAHPRLAAPRKQALVAARSNRLLTLRTMLQPQQLRSELLRLRRNAQRGWLLSRNIPVPPTALLDQEWLAAPAARRELVLDACKVIRGIRTALLEE